ncbi:hypothetical protein FKM82_017946 [Ascaphus truei]
MLRVSTRWHKFMNCNAVYIYILCSIAASGNKMLQSLPGKYLNALGQKTVTNLNTPEYTRIRGTSRARIKSPTSFGQYVP